MGLLDSFLGGFGGDSSAPAPDPTAADPSSGLTNAQMQQLRMNAMGSLGGVLLSAGQRGQTYAQRAQTLGSIGTIPGQMMDQQKALMQQKLLNTQMQAAQQQLDQKKALQTYLSDPKVAAAFDGMNPAMQALARGALASGDLNALAGLVEKTQPKINSDGSVFNPRDNTLFYPQTQQRFSIDSSTPAAGNAQAGNGQPTMGPDWFKNLPDSPVKAAAQAVLEGRSMPPPINSRSPMASQINQIINMADPSFDYNDASARKKMVDDMSTGKRAVASVTLNTFSDHLTKAVDKAQALNNGELPAGNMFSNWLENQSGDPRVKSFQTEIHAVMGEAGKMFRAGIVTDSEMKELGSNISSSGSPRQLRDVLDSFNDLVKGRADAYDAQAKQTLGSYYNDARHSVFTPESRKLRDAYDKNDWGRPKTAETAAAPSPAAASTAAPATPAAVVPRIKIDMNGNIIP